jgi:triphosphoribosyl-dephospho-CoA synthase
VNACVAPNITLLAAMQLAADRDLVARQYANGFAEVLATADRIAEGVLSGWSLSDAIVHAYVELLAANPDTLIAPKCGVAEAQDASIRSQRVVATGVPGQQAYHAAVAELDFYLRCDGHRRNPGATADVIAAALFVLLQEDRVDWPVRFYR